MRRTRGGGGIAPSRRPCARGPPGRRAETAPRRRGGGGLRGSRAAARAPRRSGGDRRRGRRGFPAAVPGTEPPRPSSSSPARSPSRPFSLLNLPPQFYTTPHTPPRRRCLQTRQQPLAPHPVPALSLSGNSGIGRAEPGRGHPTSLRSSPPRSRPCSGQRQPFTVQPPSAHPPRAARRGPRKGRAPEVPPPSPQAQRCPQPCRPPAYLKKTSRCGL